jgi:hypothetical protein
MCHSGGILNKGKMNKPVEKSVPVCPLQNSSEVTWD